MKKLIHSSFELDLSLFGISDSEENSWFSDTFFSKISYPFEIDLENNLDVAFGFISQYNTYPETIYPLKFQENDTIEDATLEIQEVTGKKLQAIYETGLDNFPSWDKKLAELSLLEFDLPEGTSIYQHAKEMINKSYPEVNYCWPMVHVNYYDATEPLYEYFESIINQFKAGNFIENEVYIATSASLNKNIMQPAIYFLYILKKGVEDAGYTLAGDILQDEIFAKMALFATVDYFKKRVPNVTDVYKSWNDYYEIININNGWFFCKYSETVDVPKWGKYLVTGIVGLSAQNPSTVEVITSKIAIFFNGILLYTNQGFQQYDEFQVDVLFISTNTPTNNLIVYAESRAVADALLFNLQLIMVEEYDDTGWSIPSVHNENKVNLKQAVPNLTFGDVVKVVKNWYNYDFDVVDKIVFMNKIENQVNYDNAISLEDYEIKLPTRSYQKGMSFLLKFSDIDNKEIKYEQIFQDASGIKSLNIVTNDKTSTIEIEGLPLPNVDKFGINTAFAFEKNDSKIYTLLYDGLQIGRNLTKDPSPMYLTNVWEKYWRKWLTFRINSIGFKWSFKAFSVDIYKLNIKQKIRAYNNYHIIKSLIKTEIKPGIIEIEITTESIK